MTRGRQVVSRRPHVIMSSISRGRDLLIVVAAALLATIPVWIPTFPPMTDLPQHAAQVALLREMLQPGFPYAASFHINWFTPYLFGYLLVYSLVPLVGMVTACKIVISIALAAVPIATAVVMTETGSDRRWALLAIPAMYAFPYHWGFLNFLVAAPLGLLFVSLALRQARQPTVAGAIALGVTINLLFFCHAMICLFFGGVAGCILLLNSRTPWMAIRQLLPLASVIPIMIGWGTRTLANPLAQRPTMWDLNWFTTDEPYYFRNASWAHAGWGWGRTAGLLPRLLGTLPGVLPTLVGLALFLLPFAAGARLSRRLTVWVPFLLCLATLLFVPGVLFGTDYTFQRFTVFALPLFLLTLEQPSGHVWPRWTWPACALLVAGWIGVVSLHAVQYEREAAGFEEILARMEPGQRAISFAYERDSDSAIAPSFLHYPSWYAALKQGVVDPSFAGTHVQVVLYRPEAQPMARLWGFEWAPGMFDWDLFGGSQYRYFVARAPRDMGLRMFRNATCPIRLVHHVNHWWLYEKDPGCGPRAPFRP
jgi:hypothetical protein